MTDVLMIICSGIFAVWFSITIVSKCEDYFAKHDEEII